MSKLLCATEHAASSNDFLGRQALDSPLVAGATVADPVVQTALTALPEFESLRTDTETSPIGRKRNLFLSIALLQLGNLLVEQASARNHLALMGDPGAEPAASWAGAEICLRLLPGGLCDGPDDSHLPVQCRPIEYQGCPGVGAELGTLLTSVVREEDEPALVVASEKYH